MAYNQGGYGGGGYGNSGYGSGGGGYGNTGGGYGGGGYGQQQQQGGYGSNPYGAGGAAGAGAGAGRYESNRYGNNAPQQGGGYGQQASNPYGGGGYGAQQQQPQQQAGGYGSQNNRYQQQQQQQQQGGYGGDSMEMSQVGGAQNGYREKASVWEEARDIVTACDRVQKEDFAELKSIQQMHEKSTDPAQYSGALGKKQGEIDLKISYFQERLKKLTKSPGVSNDERAEIARAVEKVKALFQLKLRIDNDFRNVMAEKFKRQYRIANPKASDGEIREAIEHMDEQDGQIFAQTLLNADRKGQATSTLQNVRSRNEAIQRITQQMEEVVTLFEQMNTMVVEQQTQVDTIEHQAQNVETDVEQANVQLDGAVVKARAARKKKWICLGIVVAIIIVIIIIILAWGFGSGTFKTSSTNGNNNKSN